METETYFRILLPILITAFALHRGYYVKNHSKPEDATLKKREEGIISKIAGLLGMIGFISTGAYAINPVNGEKILIWIADYVLASYGTGATMAVPAHDTRDFEFATKFNLPIVQVVHPPDPKTDWRGFVEDGTSVNSTGPEISFTGLRGAAADRP